ncbi:hypothetical protein [Amycolatopsis sp. PS_44_ISF1]|uniref:hypothetical protein n=1 Tax=Amycolatopsis sp. PS_44_ISF1 TaxID=2974917 RepID=UPI0028DE1179|nr:hypothetical protein [Amycolatopsis sp. PS_44_ISF1]MDT8913103.1 hypothetical protein [Amycolatopsis sp. PS_44_ISF1]
MASLTTEQPSTAGTARLGERAVRSIPSPAAPTGGAVAGLVGRTSHRSPVRPADPARNDAESPVRRLAAMASMREWERASTPRLMHEAILAGERPGKVAEAARLSAAEAHLRWNLWASRHLPPARTGEPAEVTVREYLRVHAAFAQAIADVPVAGEATWPES